MRIAPLLLAALALAGCANAPREERQSAALVDVRPIGPPQNCINTSLIERSQVRSDSVIDFYMRTGPVMRATLPSACPSLGSERRFSYRSTAGRLCSTDTVQVLNGSRIPGPSCSVGEFQPIETRYR